MRRRGKSKKRRKPKRRTQQVHYYADRNRSMRALELELNNRRRLKLSKSLKQLYHSYSLSKMLRKEQEINDNHDVALQYSQSHAHISRPRTSHGRFPRTDGYARRRMDRMDSARYGDNDYYSWRTLQDDDDDENENDDGPQESYYDFRFDAHVPTNYYRVHSPSQEKKARVTATASPPPPTFHQNVASPNTHQHGGYSNRPMPYRSSSGGDYSRGTNGYSHQEPEPESQARYTELNDVYQESSFSTTPHRNSQNQHVVEADASELQEQKSEPPKSHSLDLSSILDPYSNKTVSSDQTSRAASEAVHTHPTNEDGQLLEISSSRRSSQSDLLQYRDLTLSNDCIKEDVPHPVVPCNRLVVIDTDRPQTAPRLRFPAPTAHLMRAWGEEPVKTTRRDLASSPLKEYPVSFVNQQAKGTEKTHGSIFGSGALGQERRALVVERDTKNVLAYTMKLAEEKPVGGLVLSMDRNNPNVQKKRVKRYPKEKHLKEIEMQMEWTNLRGKPQETLAARLHRKRGIRHRHDPSYGLRRGPVRVSLLEQYGQRRTIQSFMEAEQNNHGNRRRRRRKRKSDDDDQDEELIEYTPDIPNGKLYCKVSCRRLLKMDLLSDSDPAVEIYIKDTNEGTNDYVATTEQLMDNHNPDFDRTFTFAFSGPNAGEFKSLSLGCYDVDRGLLETLIGSCTIDLREVGLEAFGSWKALDEQKRARAARKAKKQGMDSYRSEPDEETIAEKKKQDAEEKEAVTLHITIPMTNKEDKQMNRDLAKQKTEFIFHCRYQPHRRRSGKHSHR